MKKRFIFTEDFAELMTCNGIYIDKTLFLKQLYGYSPNNLQEYQENKVMLFTRPRRFGKSLTMSMIENFFKLNLDNPADTSKQKALFTNLAISKDTEFCDKYLGQYPVISISFKEVHHDNYMGALNGLLQTIAEVVELYMEPLLASGKLTVIAQQWLDDFIKLATNSYTDWKDESSINNIEFKVIFSLAKLAKYCFDVYGKKTIILIDEYDVPLRFAAQYDDGTNHYYQKMQELLTSLFSKTFKTQTYLEKGIITGCLRISHASIFTGVNNFVVYSVTDTKYRDFIGFTRQEVHQLLADTNLVDSEKDFLDWYDGYNFAGAEMLCPWSVINYYSTLQELQNMTNAPKPNPQSYWNNTSQNHIIDDYLSYHGNDEIPMIQELLQRKEIVINRSEFTTYQNLIDNVNIDQIFGMMLQTGYLTATRIISNTQLAVRIPNNEIYECFINKVNNLFSHNNETWFRQACNLNKAFFTENVPHIQSLITDMLYEFFSIRDMSKEGCYHIFLNTVLKLTVNSKISLLSESESGDGYPDLVLLNQDTNQAIIIELKKVKEQKDLEQSCQNALQQIVNKKYSAKYQEYRISMFGIAFWNRTCLVKLAKK